MGIDCHLLEPTVFTGQVSRATCSPADCSRPVRLKLAHESRENGSGAPLRTLAALVVPLCAATPSAVGGIYAEGSTSRRSLLIHDPATQ